MTCHNVMNRTRSRVQLIDGSMNSLPAAVDVCRSFLSVVGAISAAKAAAASSAASSSSFVDDLVETLTRQIERVEEAAWRLESAIDAAAPDPDRFKIALRRLATLKRVAVMLRSWAERLCWEDEGVLMAAPEQVVSGLKRVAAWSGRVVEKRILRIHEQSGSGAGVEPVSRDPFSLKELEEEIREIERSGPRTEEDALEDGKEFQEMMSLMKGLFLGHK